LEQVMTIVTHKKNHSARNDGAANAANRTHHKFGEMAKITAHLSGQPSAFTLAVIVIVVWAVSGPIFKFSDTWQLVINTGTTIVTFLMVFLIQNSQNRDNAAIQAKLDEIIRAGHAQNRFVGIDQLTEEEIEGLRKTCQTRARAGQART